VSCARCRQLRWTRPAAPKSSTRRASGSSPDSSTCTPTTTPRCCWTPDCASRCATVSPRCCSACARCRPSTPTPTMQPTCSAASRRCRVSSSSARCRTRPGRLPRNTSRRLTACRWARMSARCLVIRISGPRYSASTARPPATWSPPTPSSTRWPRCWTTLSRPACSACPGWTRRSTNSTATASAPGRCRPPSRRGGNAAS
jgi:hypothetical protein